MGISLEKPVLQETVDTASPISSGLRWHTECGTSHRMLVTGVPTCIVWTSYRMIPGPASRPVPVSEHPWICWKLETQSVEGGQWACWVYRATSAHREERLQDECLLLFKCSLFSMVWLQVLWGEGCMMKHTLLFCWQICSREHYWYTYVCRKGLKHNTHRSYHRWPSCNPASCL